MLEQKLESLSKTDYDMAVDVGVQFGKIVAIVVAVDLVLTLATRSVLWLLETLGISYSLMGDIMAFVKLGEIPAALVFFAIVVIFLASGIMAVKKTPGAITVAQAVCIPAVSGIITGAMASIVLVVSTVTLALLSMPQNGYITMFTQFSPDSIIDTLKWAVVIALLAIAAGVTYGGIAKKIKKLY